MDGFIIGNRPRLIYYVCNRKKCESCTPMCKYTADERFALYPDHDDFTPESVAGKPALFEVVRHG